MSCHPVRCFTAVALALAFAPACDDDSHAPAYEPPAVVYPDDRSTEPFLLSQVGFYSDFDARTVAPDLIPFAPRFTLWTDGAEKHRWLRLPPDAQLDTGDLQHFELPVGAMAFKEFVRDGVHVETRLIARTGPGPDDYWFGAFVWRDDGSDAELAVDGAVDARGTDHDVPTQRQCLTCHGGEPGRVLGLQAVQLHDAEPTSLADLAAAGRLSHPVAAERVIAPPGDAVAQAALGYLHANCGHCHNPQGAAWPDADMILLLDPGDDEVLDSDPARTTLGVPLQYFGASELDVRIAPGDANASAVILRMGERGDRTQMPPLGTELPHPDGIEIVRAWIDSL